MDTPLFEYHTFLHHSQTRILDDSLQNSLNTIHFYIILKRQCWTHFLLLRLNTIHFYIILKLTCRLKTMTSGLNTIHFYIILKPPRIQGDCYSVWIPYIFTSFSNPVKLQRNQLWRLNTIHFYIILKPTITGQITFFVWIPYIFTSFSNLSQTVDSGILVWIPYIFTSFSNCRSKLYGLKMFEYHTFLHHSQTPLVR